MNHNNLTLIGSSHIAQQSLNEVTEFIEAHRPDIVALELDYQRAVGLLSKKRERPGIRAIRQVGVKGYLFSLLGAWAEKKLGEHVGVSPGSEMKTAIKLANKHNLQIVYIDQEIQVTLRRLSESLTWKEKWNFVKDLFKGLILRKQEIEFDLRTVPEKEVIKKMIDKVKDRYPNVYKVLITERNEYMAKQLAHLLEQHPDKKILAVVGAGHEDGIKELLKAKGPSLSYKFTLSQEE